MTQRAEPVCHDLIWDVGLAMDCGDRVHRNGRRRWGTGAVAARATPRGWSELLSELLGVLRLWFAWPKIVRGHRRFLPRVQCGGGWPQGGCRAMTWTSRASTAWHGLTRGPPALGIGSQGSLRSPQDPTQSNCFGRR
jgi:hypothetical protein